MRYLALVALVVALGCDGTLTGVTPDGIEITGGNFQEAVVGERFTDPLRVTITRGSDPVSGVVVCWDGPEDSGRPSQPCVQTSSRGIAEVTWTAGIVVGLYDIVATAVIEEEPVVFDTFVLSVVAGEIAETRLETEDGLTAVFTPRAPDEAEYTSLTFRDKDGNAAPFRVEADGFVVHVGGEAGTKEGRTVRRVQELVIGDTMTIHFLGTAGQLLVDAVGEVVPRIYFYNNEPYETLGIRAVARRYFTPSEF